MLPLTGLAQPDFSVFTSGPSPTYVSNNSTHLISNIAGQQVQYIKELHVDHCLGLLLGIGAMSCFRQLKSAINAWFLPPKISEEHYAIAFNLFTVVATYT